MKKLVFFLIIALFNSIVFSQNLEKYLFDKMNKNLVT